MMGVRLLNGIRGLGGSIGIVRRLLSPSYPFLDFLVSLSPSFANPQSRIFSRYIVNRNGFEQERRSSTDNIDWAFID
jgi:hypothetical protein